MASLPTALTEQPPVQRSPLKGGALVLLGMLLIAFNLRTVITSLGSLLDEVRTGLQLSGTMAGLITSLPPIAFAVFGAFTPWLVRRFTATQVVVVGMVAVAVGQGLRVLTDNALIFIATSALALAGIAVANILMPTLVKQYFPHRIGLVTGAYTMTLVAGTSVAAAAAVPIAEAFGSWRAGLGAWALTAVVAVLPWLLIVLRRRFAATNPGTTAAPASKEAAVGVSAEVSRRLRPERTRLGWAMAIYFGTQSLGGYVLMGWLAQMFRDAGYRPQAAGLLLSAVTALGMPIALFMPAIATRLRTLRPLVLSLSLAMLLAYTGLAVLPYHGALLWVALLAIGQGAFPMVLAAIGMRARTADGTVALSTFTQSVGYLIAVLGPLPVGLLYEATSGWTAPIGFLVLAMGVQTVAGLAIARPRFIEDEIRATETNVS